MINATKAAGHFVADIAGDGLAWRRDQDKIAAGAALDGICVIRTSLPADAVPAAGAAESCKALENIERVFRGLNTDLLIRPARHRLAPWARARLLIRMLACYVIWHMQDKLAPMLAKDAAKHTASGQPAHSLATLPADLATIAASRIQPAQDLPGFTLTTTPTPVQRRAHELPGVSHRLGHP